MNIHFIICNYNAELKNCSLLKALEQLRRIKSDGVYFHIVDNSSKDTSGSILNEYSMNGILDTVLLLKVNKGKSFALNRLYELILKSYEISDNDIIISMDSDIIIVQPDFIESVKNVFQHSNAGFLGFNLFEDEQCLKKSDYTSADIYKQVQPISGRNYGVINKQSGLAGGIIAIRKNLYDKIRYNEVLGKERTPAVYGGDDAVLTFELFKSGMPGVYDINSQIVHTPHSKEYNEWKKHVIDIMCHNGYGHNTLPDRGFFD